MITRTLIILAGLTTWTNAAITMLNVVNGDFETDSAPSEGATGWVIATGGTATEFWTTDGTGLSAADPDSAQAGSNFLTSNRVATDPDTSSNPASSTASQNIDLSTFAAGIDLGTATLDVDFFYNAGDGNDTGEVTIEFFDGSSGSLGTATSGSLTSAADVWVAGTIDSGTIAIPTATRSFTINLLASRPQFTATNVSYDSISASINAVPEPSALLLGAMSSLLLLRRRR